MSDHNDNDDDHDDENQDDDENDVDVAYDIDDDDDENSVNVHNDDAFVLRMCYKNICYKFFRHTLEKVKYLIVI